MKLDLERVTFLKEKSGEWPFLRVATSQVPSLLEHLATVTNFHGMISSMALLSYDVMVTVFINRGVIIQKQEWEKMLLDTKKDGGG